jgi:hypothetical protein
LRRGDRHSSPNLKPSAKASRFFDERGLYLEVSPSGGKWWRLKYRFSGKEKRLSLGVYPHVGLKDARERRDRSRKLIADGIDPAENRKALKSARISKAANSFEVVAREWLDKQRCLLGLVHRPWNQSLASSSELKKASVVLFVIGSELLFLKPGHLNPYWINRSELTKKCLAISIGGIRSSALPASAGSEPSSSFGRAKSNTRTNPVMCDVAVAGELVYFFI